MKKYIKRVINKILLLTTIILIFNGCEQQTTPTLYNLAVNKGPTPVINSLDPPNESLAYVSTITINGENFSTVPDENLVFFNGVRATVLNASATKLEVSAPNIISDTVIVKIAKSGNNAAQDFSNEINYKLKPAIFNIFPPINSIMIPYSLTVDAQDNVYVSVVAASIGQGIKKISPDGTVSDFAPKGGETYFSTIKMGPNNTIYAARKVRAIFIVQEGVSAKTWVTYADGIGSIDAIDFDKDKNLWAGGAGNGAIYRITQSKEVKSFNFDEDVKSIKILDENLYIASKNDVNETIWKVQIISPDSLGNPEKYFDFSSNFEGYTINALDASADGDIYVGTDAPDAIIIVHPDKSYEPLYSGLFEEAPAFSFGSGNGVHLYYTRESVGSDISQAIIKINIQKEIAPNFGIK